MLSLALLFLFLAASPALARVEYAKKAELRCIHCHVDRAYPGESFYEAEEHYKWNFFWALTAVSLSSLCLGIFLRVRIWRLGQKTERNETSREGIARPLLFDALLQRGIWRLSRVRWAGYATLSLGFLALFSIALLSYIFLFAYGSRSFTVPGPVGVALDALADLFGLFVLVGVVIAAVRRYCSREGRLRSEVTDGLALVLIGFIVGTGFLLESFRIAALPYAPSEACSFVGFAISLVLRPVQVPWAAWHFYTWNIHMMAALAFIAYIPYSKFVHIMTCPVTAATYRRRTGFTEGVHG